MKKGTIKMDITNAQRARILVHALPYIQDYSGKIVVIKYGGNAMVNVDLKDSVMRDIIHRNAGQTRHRKQICGRTSRDRR